MNLKEALELLPQLNCKDARIVGTLNGNSNNTETGAAIACRIKYIKNNDTAHEAIYCNAINGDSCPQSTPAKNLLP